MKPSHQWTSTKTAPTRQTIWSQSRCLRICLRKCTTTKTRWQKTPHRILLHYPEQNTVKLQHLQAGTPSHCWVSKTLETLSSWLTTQNHSTHWPCQPHILVSNAENQSTYCKTSVRTGRVQYQITTSWYAPGSSGRWKCIFCSFQAIPVHSGTPASSLTIPFSWTLTQRFHTCSAPLRVPVLLRPSRAYSGPHYRPHPLQ